MHGIRLDSDVEDTPDKQGPRQRHYAGGRAVRLEKDLSEAAMYEKAGSPGLNEAAVNREAPPNGGAMPTTAVETRGGQKKTVQAKLLFFAPQVRRISKITEVQPAAPTATQILATEPAADPDRLRGQQQPDTQQRKQGLPCGLQESTAQTHTIAPGALDPFLCGAAALGSLLGCPSDLESHFNPLQVDLTGGAEEVGKRAAEDGSTGANAAACHTSVEAASPLLQRQKRQIGDGTITTREQSTGAAMVVVKLAPRVRRQALLPGVPSPAPEAPSTVAVHPGAVAGAVAGGKSPVKKRQRGSRTAEVEGSGVPTEKIPRGRGRAARGWGRRGGAVDSALAVQELASRATVVILSDDEPISCEDEDIEQEDEQQLTGSRRGSNQGRGTRGTRGRGRGDAAGQGRGRRPRRGSGAGGESHDGLGQPDHPQHRSAGALDAASAAVGLSVGLYAATAEVEGQLCAKQGEKQIQTATLLHPAFGACLREDAAAHSAAAAASAAGTALPECAGSADVVKEDRLLLRGWAAGAAASTGAATASGDGSGDVAAAWAPKPMACGPGSEMFLSVAERKWRQKQRQDEEAEAARRQAREQRDREQSQRERDQGQERQKPVLEGTAAAVVGTVEVINLLVSPPRPQPPVPVNPFFRARKRPDPSPVTGSEDAGSIKRLANRVGAGGAAAAAVRLLPALAPVHMRQLPPDTVVGNYGPGAPEPSHSIVHAITAAARCLLKLNDAGLLSLALAPSETEPRWTQPLLNSAAAPATAMSCGVEGLPRLSQLRLQLLPPRQLPPEQPIPRRSHGECSAAADGGQLPPRSATATHRACLAAGVKCGGDLGGGGGSRGGDTGDPSLLLLNELATYLADTQSREATVSCRNGVVMNAEAEADLLDLPTREDVLRQLTDELAMLRRRMVLKPQALPQQHLQEHLSGADGGGGGRAGGGGGAGIRPWVSTGGCCQEQLWCVAQQPLCAKELCGNAAQVGRLREWLQQWREVIRQEGQRPAGDTTAIRPCGRRPRRLSNASSDSLGMDFNDDSDWDARSAGGTADSDGEARGGGEVEHKGGHKGLPTAMVLRGPPGCGKTAAAFAVASELSFRVLEVNPSADRSGQQLLRLVGEATKSRRLVQSLAAGTVGRLGEKSTAATAAQAAAAAVALVRGGRRGREATRGRRGGGGASSGGRRASRHTQSLEDVEASANSSPSMSPVKRRGGATGKGSGAADGRRLDAKSDAPAPAAAAGTIEDDVTTTGAKATGASSTTAADETCTRTGSVTLMLFDEVDVLPEEDKGFLGALASIVQQSKRPIVLTAGRGQLPAALRSLGLPELHFQPPSEPEQMRAVVMACAAAMSERAPPRHHPSSAEQGPSGSLERGIETDTASEVMNVGVVRNGEGNCGVELTHTHRGSSRQPLLPWVLQLVRSCRGDLRHALLEAQFWLGAGGSSASGGEGLACMLGSSNSGASIASALDDGLGDECREALFAAQVAIDGAVLTAAAVASSAVAAGATSLHVTAASGCALDCYFGAVLPCVRMWVPDQARTESLEQQRQEQQQIPNPIMQLHNQQQQLSTVKAGALSARCRRMQWQSYEEECRRVRVEQLAIRWMELAAARPASNRRSRGFFGPGQEGAEEELAAELMEEGDEAEGSAGGTADEALEREQTSEDGGAGPVPGASGEEDEGAALELAAPDQGIAVAVVGRNKEVLRHQHQQNQQQEGSHLAQEWSEAGGEVIGCDLRGTSLATVQNPAAPTVLHSHQLPQKRRASEDTDGTGAWAGPLTAAPGDGGGEVMKRSRISLTRSASRANTPREHSLPVAVAEACLYAIPRPADSAEPARTADIASRDMLPEPPLVGHVASRTSDPWKADAAAPAPAISSPCWLFPPAPPPLQYIPEVVSALAAPLPAVSRGISTQPIQEQLRNAVRDCRTQAALADLYSTLSDLDILAVPRDVFVPVSGACPVQHQASYASVQPISLATNMALQLPPFLDTDDGSGRTAWVLADAIRGQEDVPGRLLSALAAEAEAAGLGAGEPAGPVGRWCALEAAASATRLATAAAAAVAISANCGRAEAPIEVVASVLRHGDERIHCAPRPISAAPTAGQLNVLRGALQSVAPGLCAGGSAAAMDRLAALSSICRSEAARQHREARRARWMRRPLPFSCYLTDLEPFQLAALHGLATALETRTPAGSEARARGEEVQEVGTG